jgi:hypothetical protein
MAPKTPPPPGQAFQDALDPALLRRLRRRAERPGLVRPWQAQAMLARHRRMLGGLPLAELLLRRAEVLADERAAWAPIVYARPAGPGRPPATPAGTLGSSSPAAIGPGRPPRTDHLDAARAGTPPGPVLRPTATRTAPRPPGSPPAPSRAPTASDGAAQGVRRGPAAAAPSTPIHPGRPDPQLPRGTRAEAVAASGPAAAARAGRPEPPVVARPAPAPPAAPRDRGGAPPPAPTWPVVEPVRPARPPGAPGLVLVTAAATYQQAPPPGGTPPGGTSSSLPVVQPAPGRPVPWAPAAQTRDGGRPALPVVSERVTRAAGANRAWAAPAGVPASLPLAPAAGVPAKAPSAAPAVPPPPPPPVPGTRAAAGPVPAARGAEDGRERGRGARPQRVVLAPVEIDRVANKVQRKLLHRLAIEAERRGTSR